MISIQKAILYGAGDLRLDEEVFDPDTLGPQQVLVRTLATGFSTGTDLANYQGRSTELPGAPDYPRSVGYSNVGVVWMTGEEVSTLRPGDRVFSMKPHCSAFVANEGELLVHVPAALDPEEVALAYLVNLGLSAVRCVDYEAGERIAVVGLGVIGLCTVALARAIGAPVIAIANDQARAGLAMSLGATAAYQSGGFEPEKVFDGEGADIVVLTANTWAAYRTSVDIVRHGGRVSVLGFPGRGQAPPDFNPLDPEWFYGKQLTLKAAGFAPRVECRPAEIRFNLRRNLVSIFEWMSSGMLHTGPLISHRFRFDQMRDAYELASHHCKELTAAVFDWRTAHDEHER